MKRACSPFPCLAVIVILLAVLPAPGAHAAMASYCQQQPYIIQNATPNILFMESTSKIMNRFAYYDGFLDPGIIPTTDNLCITDNCTRFTRPENPTYKYTGFFNPDYWYTYGGNAFTRSTLKGGAKPARAWDGNFLNWLTMRRFDILQQVLIGKKRAADSWQGQGAADASAGLWKRITNAQNYIDNTVGTDTVTFKFNIQSGNQPSDFTVISGGTGSEGTFKVVVNPVTDEKWWGVFQDAFPKARAGIAQASGDGMRVWSKIDFSWNQADINQIVNTPSSQLGNQGLANQLWGIAGYFANTTSIPSSGSWSPSPVASNWNYMSPNKDPMNYNNQYYGCASNYVIYITDGDPSGDGNIPDQLKNYAAKMSSPFNCGGSGSTLPSTCNSTTAQGVTNFPFYAFPPATDNVSGLEDVALWVHTTDLRSSTIGSNEIAGKQNLTLYVVNAFGSASTYLKYVAINGGFEDLGAGIPDTRSTWAKGTSEVPYNYYEAKDKDQLQKALTEAVNSILKRAASGTAASVLASGEGSGANLLQAVFYPRRRFSNDIIMWAGSLQNLWYYVDPQFGNATIREETVDDGKLNLKTDAIVQFFFDNDSQTTKVARTQDVNGDGKTLVALDNVVFEDMDSLWEAGKKLYYMSASDRVIKTTTDGATFTAFDESNASALSSDLAPVSPQTATDIIRYTLGYDNIVSRNRTVAIGSDNNVWKLGDILTSTPRIVSSIPLVKYYETYSDRTYGPISDNTTFTGGNIYKNRGMVFAGGNDGMLHAFKLGKLEQGWSGQNKQVEKAKLTNLDTSVPLGQEMWGFIPKNALPYLKYLSDNNYCHLAYVDLPPYVFDASIGGNPTDTRTASSWRTILIGGMRTGGACKDTCATSDCVQTPATGKGFSSYFALDVTNPEAPSLLWEFSDETLGFSTTGPAIVRINAFNSASSLRDKNLNGEWYVVFGSGPTGPIDTTYQFLGRSDQPLRLFIRNLKTGALVQTITTSITNAFAGSMLNATADYNLDYQDDAVYIPYVKKSGSTWTDGGVLRLVPTVSPTTNSTTWAVSTVIDGIGPVTSSVVHLQSNTAGNGNAWLYFGTGRYYYDHPPGAGSYTSPDIDDPVNRRALFAVKEQCFSASGGVGFFDSNCASTSTSTLTLGQLDDVTDIANVKAEATTNLYSYKGWFLNLDAAGTYTYDGSTRVFYPERVITDPLASTAGLVYFTAFKPYGDYCAIGGKSFLWALRYNTGGAPTYGLKGKALLQVSTAAIEQLDLSAAFSGGTDSTLHKGGRRSYAMEGVPPVSQGLSILSSPPPLKRILHMMER